MARPLTPPSETPRTAERGSPGWADDLWLAVRRSVAIGILQSPGQWAAVDIEVEVDVAAIGIDFEVEIAVWSTDIAIPVTVRLAECYIPDVTDG